MKNKKFKVDSIRLISIDGDGCLFSYENVGSKFHSSWDALGFAYGLKEIWDERIKKYYKKSRNGGYDVGWAETDIADLKGRSIKKAERVLKPIPYCKGAFEFARATKGGMKRGLLTTAIDYVAEDAKRELGLDFVFCNKLHRSNGYFTGTLDYDVPTWKKHEKLSEICRTYGVELKEICHIGDNENDLSVAEMVGMFITLKPKKKNVADRADFIADDFFDVMRIFRL